MLTFEEWRHTYADIFETDDAARAAWTAASNKGYSAGVQDTRELLAAHSAGAQEPVAFRVMRRDTISGEWVTDGRFWCDGKPSDDLLREVDGETWRVELAYAAQPQPMLDSAGAQGEPVGYMMKHKTGMDIGFAWKKDDLKFSSDWLRIPLYAQPQLMPQTDAARDAKDAKRYRLLRERYFTRADNPNTSAYHCVGIFTSWLPAATIDRDGLDAVLDAEIERLDGAKGE